MTGPELRAIRAHTGLTQFKFARAIGSNQTRITIWERGVVMIPDAIAEKIAVTFPQAVRSAKVEKEEAPPKGRRTRPKQIAEDKAAEVAWKRQTEAHLRGDARHGARQYVENDTSESTDRENVSGESTSGVDRARPGFEKSVVTEVRMCSTVELGPETMKALKDMIETAVRELAKVKAQAPVTIRPEVIKAAKEGDRYRAQVQEKLGRGW